MITSESPSVVAAIVKGSADTPLRAKFASVFGFVVIPLLVQRASVLVQHGKRVEMQRWYRGIWLTAFLVNLGSLSVPGRFDSESTRSANASIKKNGKTILNFTPVFAPAGWAFTIWGLIYFCEILLTTIVATPGSVFPDMEFLRIAAPFWMGANLFQSLWCACFRPKFKSMLWFPSLCLVMAAFYQLRCLHMIMKNIPAIATGPDLLKNYKALLSLPNIGMFVSSFPVALHGGWLMAAALLNINNWATESGITYGVNIAMAFLSAYLATALGTYASLRTRNPFIMVTISWALRAVSSNTKENDKLDKDTREALCLTEAQLSNALLASAPIISFAAMPLVKVINDQIF